ncbi:serine protease inhibitor Kazal-type 2 [Eurosta solidaginis]|uniref:serine protease inhibitor Kazal-type 2 n=1 Tax=Eurosta solidaginis TaxID=178769 RepID=UPI00353168E6
MQFLQFITSLLLSIILLTTLTKAERALCPCARNYDPVCDTNLVTHANRCEYDCVRRDVERRGRSLNLLRNGPC